MRIAVIGAGISGLAATWLLQRRHEVTLFEAGATAGGHAHTVDVEHEGRRHAVDTGFVVYNETTYPRLVELFAELGVATRPSDMSFSVRNERTGLEYCGSGFRTLFAQRRNLFSPRFHSMLVDILRFHRTVEAAAERLGERATLGDLVAHERYSKAFVDDFLTPMVGAIWSTPAGRMLDAPALFLVRFLKNHGMLSVDGQLPWRTVTGGSRSYVDALVAKLRTPPRVSTPIRAVRRLGDAIEIVPEAGGRVRFHQVVFAVHSDQALALLEDADDGEREALGAIRYATNAVTLHSDISLLPRRRAARASWNFHAGGPDDDLVRLTYDMSRLQGLATRTPLLVTLNRDEAIAPETVLARFRYAHPRYDLAATAAQRRIAERNGARRTWYCGAWMGNGFHEDGLVSAHAVARALSYEVAA
ncbi:MAG: NAD(P)/FAD-dependent oxidoreductase [Thermoanaerobaculia bacterium]